MKHAYWFSRGLKRLLALTSLVGLAIFNNPPALHAQTAPTPLAPDRVAYYPRLMRLAHGGAANGRLIASFDNGSTGAIYESTNDGATWQSVGNILSNPPAGNCCSGLYEVPQQLGNTAAGTLLWATSFNANKTANVPSALRIYRSTDVGRTWSLFSIAAAGTTGLWEAEFNVDSQGRLVMYFSSEEHKAEGYNQLLAHRISPDGGLTWGPDVIDVGVNDNVARPGMAVVRKLASGQYVMTYEVCGTRNCDAYLRTSANGTDWGDPTNMGTRIESVGGRHFAHAPTVAVAADGKLLAVGQELRNNSDNRTADLNGKVVMVNANNGAGLWTEIAAPVEVPGAYDNPCPNYSSQILPSADNTRLLEIALDYVGGACHAFYNTGSITAAPNTAFAPATLADGVYRLVSKNSGRVLDVDKCSKDNFGNVQQYDWLGGDCQRWAIEPVSPNSINADTYRLTAKHSGKVLNVAACSKDNLAQVQQDDWLGEDCQRWTVEPTSDGYYRLISKNRGKVLDVDGCSKANGAKVQQYTWLGGDCQRWGFELVEPGYYRIISKNSGRVLDVTACSTQSGAKVQQYDWLGGDCQRWKLEVVSGIIMSTAGGAGKAPLAVYPNPATTELLVRQEFNKATAAQLVLSDALGRVQRTSAQTVRVGSNTFVLDVRGLAAGLYTLRLQYGQGYQTQQIAIQP